jgi:hypothetical protein
MKITKQRLKEIIKEELQNLNEVDRGQWVIERDGVTADEKYLSRGLRWGPQNRAEVHEFKQEAQGVLRTALEMGKIDSGRVSEVSTIEEWTKDQARNIFNNRAPDDGETEKETPAQMADRVRKRFQIQQSQKRDLARHKRQRGLKSKAGFEQ